MLKWVALGVCALAASVAQAAERPVIDTAKYPPSGIFGVPRVPLSPDEERERAAQIALNNRFLEQNGIKPIIEDPLDPCFVQFNVKDGNGHYIGYGVDEGLFSKTGEVAYIEAEQGQCQYDPGQRLETCRISMLDSELTLTTLFAEGSFTRLLEFYDPSELQDYRDGAAGYDFFDVLDCSPVADILMSHIEAEPPAEISYPDDADEGFIFRRAIEDPQFVGDIQRATAAAAR